MKMPEGLQYIKPIYTKIKGIYGCYRKGFFLKQTKYEDHLKYNYIIAQTKKHETHLGGKNEKTMLF